MQTAQEMSKLSEDARVANYRTLVCDIEKQIYESANLGYFSLEYEYPDFSISKDMIRSIIDAFTNLGYDVYESSIDDDDMDIPALQINWHV